MSALGRILGKTINDTDFNCNLVKYQLKPDEIGQINSCENSELKNWKKLMVKRGEVKSGKYLKRQRRWANDEIQCEFCGRWYGVNEIKHNAQFCVAASGQPLTERNLPYPFAYLKRFRHLTRKVP